MSRFGLPFSRTPSSRLLVATLVATAAAAFPSGASAFPYIVRPGETLAQIADRFYGRIEREQILVAANGLDVGRGVPVAAGMRLEIPAVSHVRVTAGQTWGALAEAWLGESDRGYVMAVANDAVPWIPPADGQEVVVPYNLKYVASQGDSTLTVAYRFLGERDAAWTLDRYNHLRGQPLRRGDVLLVPISDLPLTAEGKAAAAAGGSAQRAEGAGQAREAQRRAEAELPSLAGDLRGGRYVDVVARANRILGYGELTRPQIATIQRKLTEAYVALDAIGLAQTACAAWRDSDPEAELDPVLLSPKIVRACVVRDASIPEPSRPSSIDAGAEGGDDGGDRQR